jgi:hypothetical protein
VAEQDQKLNCNVSHPNTLCPHVLTILRMTKGKSAIQEKMASKGEGLDEDEQHVYDNSWGMSFHKITLHRPEIDLYLPEMTLEEKAPWYKELKDLIAGCPNKVPTGVSNIDNNMNDDIFSSYNNGPSSENNNDKPSTKKRKHTTLAEDPLDDQYSNDKAPIAPESVNTSTIANSATAAAATSAPAAAAVKNESKKRKDAGMSQLGLCPDNSSGNSSHVQHLAPICRTSSVFQHHSDPILATLVAKIAASPLSCLRLPLFPLHSLVPFPVPLSCPISIQHTYLHTPFTTHLSLCHMFKTPIFLSYHHWPSQPYQTSCFTIALDFHKYLFSVMHCIASCIVYSRAKEI